MNEISASGNLRFSMETGPFGDHLPVRTYCFPWQKVGLPNRKETKYEHLF